MPLKQKHPSITVDLKKTIYLKLVWNLTFSMPQSFSTSIGCVTIACNEGLSVCKKIIDFFFFRSSDMFIERNKHMLLSACKILLDYIFGEILTCASKEMNTHCFQFVKNYWVIFLKEILTCASEGMNTSWDFDVYYLYVTLVLCRTAEGSRALFSSGFLMLVLIQQMSSHRRNPHFFKHWKHTP